MEDAITRVNALVRESFAAAAENYRQSPRHGDPAGLRRMLGVVEPRGGEIALDLATGGGHTAAALGPFVRRVVAFDLLPEMLAQARELFGEARLPRVELVAGDVHALPFADRAFDLVTCRCAPHHFADLPRACAEIARCLRPGGRFYLNDCGVPAEPDAAAWVNSVERLRDPSHVRALSASEWGAALRDAGFEVALLRELPNVYPVREWLDHLDSPRAVREAVFDALARAPDRLPACVSVDLTPGRETFSTIRVESLALRPAARGGAGHRNHARAGARRPSPPADREAS